MGLLPFGKLEPHRSRKFVPAEVDLGNWQEIAPLFEKLSIAAERSVTVPALETWLLDWSELSAALDEESSKRYIAMTCHTEDAEAEKAYLQFVEEIEPQTKPKQFELAKKFAAHPLRAQLPKSRYEV